MSMNLDLYHSFGYIRLLNQFAVDEFLAWWYCPLEYVLWLAYSHIEIHIILLEITFLLFLFYIVVRYILL